MLLGIEILVNKFCSKALAHRVVTVFGIIIFVNLLEAKALCQIV